jgi:penicillin-binding protein 2
MLVTPLQMANALCIVANKGYYYTPHFVKELENETKEDTLLNKYRARHEVLTHISDTAYEVVHAGMQDVVEAGTARAAKIEGISICAKTGTAENYRIIKGMRTKLKDNSMFVAFAPRENPKIAIAVVVENAGFGATWAAPMASLMIEKFLRDSLRADRVKEVERIAAENLMPGWLKGEQYSADSARAMYYFNLTKDSVYLKKFFGRKPPTEVKKDTTKPKPVATKLAASKKPLPKPTEPDSGRVGFLFHDELFTNEQRLQKRRALLS